MSGTLSCLALHLAAGLATVRGNEAGMRTIARLSMAAIALLIGTAGLGRTALPALAEIQLPPAEEIPEEILRTEIITEARSPINGEPMSPAAYAELQAQLEVRQTTPTIRSDLRQLILLLQIRRGLKPILPFLP